MYETEGPQLGAPTGLRLLGDNWSDLHCQGGRCGTSRLPTLCLPQMAPESESALTVNEFLLRVRCRAQAISAMWPRFFFSGRRDE